jgi:3',5'-cyclic AMP phosphodiesterase CpdA
VRNSIRLLHISDLHFVRALATEPRGWLVNAIYALKARPHSFGKLDAFRVKVAKIELQQSRITDLVLGTGDLTTNGDRGALETVRTFINDQKVYGGRPRQKLIEGLGASVSNRLLLPGNHDRYSRDWLPLQTRSDAFETVLGTPDQYPYVVGFRPRKYPNSDSSPALLFFVFDSTPSMVVSYNPLALLAPRRFKPWEVTARGRLEAAACRDLVDFSRKVQSDKTVKTLDGADMRINFDTCIRIAVLHHHPMDNRNTTLMENRNQFIEYCFRAGIDLILFGHDHRQYIKYLDGYGPHDVLSVGNPHRVYFFCCPSTSEFSSKNGFYIFDFWWDNKRAGFDFSLYEWQELISDFTLTNRKSVPFNRTF